MEVMLRLQDGSLTRARGATGEIVVRGKSVSYGYLKNPEKTRSAFIQNPLHSDFHDPIYLTGDLGKIDDQGCFIFLGRKDQQIKYMGNRIELGEIESALNRVPGVGEGVVVFNDAPELEKKCIGALVCLVGEATVEEVAASLKGSLPGYMVPRKFVVTADLPRTPNGKADRRAAFSMLFSSES
jgi:acyl-coenzyme A synthetase/AMP-(fatty) acid ligase